MHSVETLFTFGLIFLSSQELTSLTPHEVDQRRDCVKLNRELGLSATTGGCSGKNLKKSR